MTKPPVHRLVVMLAAFLLAFGGIVARLAMLQVHDNPALTTPLSYTGTPEELDAELGKHLASYVECHTQLGSTLAQAKSEMEAAAKTAQEEARKKAAERSKKPAEKPVTGAGSAPVVPAPAQPAATMTLFERSQPTASGATITTAATTAGEGGCRMPEQLTALPAILKGLQ